MLRGKPPDLRSDRGPERRQGRLDRRRQRRAEPGRGGAEPDERPRRQRAAEDRRQPDHLLDRKLVRRTRDRAAVRLRQQPFEGHHHHLARLDSDSGVDEHARDAIRDAEQRIDVERRGAVLLDQAQNADRQPIDRARTGGVVAPLGLATHDEPDPCPGRVDGARRADGTARRHPVTPGRSTGRGSGSHTRCTGRSSG